jgi:hypothetical protein
MTCFECGGGIARSQEFYYSFEDMKEICGKCYAIDEVF